MQPPGREALGVEVEIAPHVVGEADGVGLVVDRERRPVAEHRRVAAEDARARGVEGGHPHAVRDRADEVGDPLLHLARGLVGEGDGEQPERRHPLLGDEERHPVGEHPRLAAPAPAITRIGPSGADAASRCTGLSPASSVSVSVTEASYRRAYACSCVYPARDFTTSSRSVTGPSLTSSTCMSAPKRPVATVAPRSRSASANVLDEWLGLLGSARRRPTTAAGRARCSP